MKKDDTYREQLELAKRESAAQLLMKCARLVNERALSRVKAKAPRGRATPRPAHTALFPHIALEGSRVSEIAARAGISKQAVSQLVDDLEELGLVERKSDPSDARARRVVWTARGKRGLLEGLSTLAALEAELEAAVGAAQWQGLAAGLQALHDHLTAAADTGDAG